MSYCVPFFNLLGLGHLDFGFAAPRVNLRFSVYSLALVWFDDGSVVEMEIKQSEKEAHKLAVLLLMFALASILHQQPTSCNDITQFHQTF